MTPAEYVAARVAVAARSRLLRRHCERLGFRSEAVPAVLWYAEDVGSVRCCAEVGHHPMTVRDALDELEAAGAIVPDQHHDRRRKGYRLTDSGRDLARRFEEALA